MREDDFATGLAALIAEALKAGLTEEEVVSGLETATEELQGDTEEDDTTH